MNALAKLIFLFILGCVGLSMLSTYLFSRPNNPYSLYDVLGLDSVQATNRDIKQHYRSLIRKLHPDHQRQRADNGEAPYDSPFTLDQVNQAYNTLSNPTKRIRYDFSLANPTHFHYSVYKESSQDKIKRIYEYDTHWDNAPQLFYSVDKVLVGYSMKYPQHSKLAREIYTNNNDSDSLEQIDIKPYILVRSQGYDNVITYHFSDWTDQLDRPRQLIMNTGLIIFSLVSAFAPIWFVFSSSSSTKDNESGDDDDHTTYDENGNPIRDTREQHERAGWSQQDIDFFHQKLLEKKQIEDENRKIENEEKERIRELNKKNKEVNQQLKQEKLEKANFPVQSQYTCTLCKKSYSTEAQYDQHCVSSKHLKALKEEAKKKK